MSDIKIAISATVHVSVGVAVVVISSFVNSELKFQGWEVSQITIYLGIPILFELFRLYFGYLYDTKNLLRSSFLLGTIVSFSGIVLMPYSLVPIGNPLLIVNVSLFYLGSAIMTTLTDSYLTEFSSEKSRGTVAGILQLFRLLGFAIGGFVGSILYSVLDFTIFLQCLAIFYLTFAMVTLVSFHTFEKAIVNKIGFLDSLQELVFLRFSKEVYLMTIFLLLYPIGLFMQDLILEPFAITQFDFDKTNVGTIVAIWTSTTLLFVPIGVIAEKITSPIYPIVFGEILAAGGLTGFALTPLFNSITFFYIALICFGMGNGIASAPAIRVMLDVSIINKANLAFLLGFFGILITIGRSLASVLGGIILVITRSNYSILFLIEVLATLLTIPPIYILIKSLENKNDVKQTNGSLNSALILD